MQKSKEYSQEANQAEWYSFKNSRWARLYETIPWDALEACLPEVNHGLAPYFGRKGKFALMFLKHELGVSDAVDLQGKNGQKVKPHFCDGLLSVLLRTLLGSDTLARRAFFSGCIRFR